MDLNYQAPLLSQLKLIANKDVHSILISGLRGSGKTYCAKWFAVSKGIDTFHSVKPKVADLKAMITSSYQLQDNQVICIENLDDGTDGAAQVILKYLEEPLPNVYIFVTCTNCASIPDTILSRVISLELPHPRINDLAQYARAINAQRYNAYKEYAAYKTCKTLSDVRQVLNMSLDQIKYYDNFYYNCDITELSISEAMWNINHYPDNSKCDIKISLRCLFDFYRNTKNAKYVLNSLLSLENSRISETAILGKLMLDLNYGD